MRIIEERKVINGIPVLLCFGEDGGKKPLVILSHGFTGSKTYFKELGYLKELAEAGYYAAAIDNRLHGDRPGPDFRTAVINSKGEVDLYTLRKAMKETADDVKLLIDELTLQEEIDSDRIAMIGISMGGFITFRSIVLDDRIKVGIPIISSPYWDDIPGDISIHRDDSVQDEFAALIDTFQPADCIDRFYPAALLMQVGGKDQHYNLAKVQDFYQRLQVYYSSSPERLRLIVYPETKHEVTSEMWIQALRWLKVYLAL